MSEDSGTGTSGSRVVIESSGTPNEAVPGMGMLGMSIFLASLSVLFTASLVAYVLVRVRADSWRPEGVPVLPWGVLLSTAMLAASSVFIQQGLNAIRRGDSDRLRRKLGMALVLAFVFVGNQAWNWWRMLGDGGMLEGTLYGFTFFMLTALHALHVIGGVVGLVVVWIRAGHGAYSWASYPGVRYNTIYWHFLGVVWVVLLLVLFFGSI